MSSHNTDTGNSEKGESWQLGERKLWLPGVPAPDTVARQKSELGLV